MIKCVVCEISKFGIGVKRVIILLVVLESVVIMVVLFFSCIVIFGILGFVDKFKRFVGFWECLVCCIFNNVEDNKCVFCMFEKLGTLMIVWNNFVIFLVEYFNLFFIILLRIILVF